MAIKIEQDSSVKQSIAVPVSKILQAFKVTHGLVKNHKSYYFKKKSRLDGAINVLKYQYLLILRCKSKDLVTNSMPLLISNIFLIIFLFLICKFHIAFSSKRGSKLLGTE